MDAPSTPVAVKRKRDGDETPSQSLMGTPNAPKAARTPLVNRPVAAGIYGQVPVSAPPTSGSAVAPAASGAAPAMTSSSGTVPTSVAPAATAASVAGSQPPTGAVYSTAPSGQMGAPQPTYSAPMASYPQPGYGQPHAGYAPRVDSSGRPIPASPMTGPASGGRPPQGYAQPSTPGQSAAGMHYSSPGAPGTPGAPVYASSPMGPPSSGGRLPPPRGVVYNASPQGVPPQSPGQPQQSYPPRGHAMPPAVGQRPRFYVPAGSYTQQGPRGPPVQAGQPHMYHGYGHPPRGYVPASGPMANTSGGVHGAPPHMAPMPQAQQYYAPPPRPVQHASTGRSRSSGPPTIRRSHSAPSTRPPPPHTGTDVPPPPPIPANPQPFYMPEGGGPFSGAWRLDKAHSQSMQRHLLALGVDAIAVQAADKLDIVLVVEQSPTECTITKRSQLGSKTCHQKFGVPLIETAENGTKRQSTMVFDSDKPLMCNTIHFTLRGKECVCEDSRTLIQSGHVLEQHLKLRLPSGRMVSTVRRYNRTTLASAGGAPQRTAPATPVQQVTPPTPPMPASQQMPNPSMAMLRPSVSTTSATSASSGAGSDASGAKSDAFSSPHLGAYHTSSPMSVGAGLLLSGPGAPAELQGGTDDDDGLDIDHSLDDDDERLMDSLISSPTGHAVGLQPSN